MRIVDDNQRLTFRTDTFHAARNRFEPWQLFEERGPRKIKHTSHAHNSE